MSNGQQTMHMNMFDRKNVDNRYQTTPILDSSNIGIDLNMDIVASLILK
jgi:hypothetical protein